jgi:hypothetical protein
MPSRSLKKSMSLPACHVFPACYLEASVHFLGWKEESKHAQSTVFYQTHLIHLPCLG